MTNGDAYSRYYDTHRHDDHLEAIREKHRVGCGMPARITRHGVGGYTCEISYSHEDVAWVATFPALLGCTAHGETHDEALKEARTAMGLWLETCVEMGRELPEPVCGDGV